MKNFFLLSLLIVGATAHAQNVLRVNNTAGVNAPFTTLAAAITAANVNDIIMVEGSLMNYGDVTIAKKVTMVGPGYFLSQNLGLQATVASAAINSITLNTGADGSSFSGLDNTGPTAANVHITINGVNNITISNCRLQTNLNLNGTANNLLLQGNFMSSILGAGTSSYMGAIITNSLFGGNFTIGTTSFFTITNCVISSSATLQLLHSDIRNCIIVAPTSSVGITGSVFKNNILTNSSVPAPDGTNAINVSATIFAGTTNFISDAPYKLIAGSPAIGFGELGIDCGMYGGGTPYRLSGIKVGQPTITNFSSPASVQQNILLNVKVSAKVN
jgi:hypothetical protein